MARPPDKADPSQPWAGMSTGLGISVTMLSGPAIWGLIGYLIDRLAGTEKVFTAIGMVLGAAGAAYIVYLRFGKEPAGQGPGKPAASSGSSSPAPGGEPTRRSADGA